MDDEAFGMFVYRLGMQKKIRDKIMDVVIRGGEMGTGARSAVNAMRYNTNASEAAWLKRYDEVRKQKGGGA
jgi:hypothetical protein